ncbi:type II secretion system protein [Pseudomonas sp. 1912-s]|uniref:prepilin-type N-terminal cleavage/methylation domain-containing protein n=1 Tax=Pseudomonas sp. 1912-s TaxID=3033802 RepID=UPI0023DF7900|nr:type II secretion system protein [Pseudomonas sp. 1912-s]MDF3202955.1 type II secretion system protein [Pseudomonas sp. 1912-s]
MRFRRATQSGFTLIEMLAAITLFALALGIFMSAMGHTLQRYTKSELKSRMGLLARSLMAEQASGHLESAVNEGHISGVFWRIECEELEAQSGVRLFHVTLTLRQGRTVEIFNTLRVKPLKMGQ